MCFVSIQGVQSYRITVQEGCYKRWIFKMKFNRFEFRLLFLPDWLPYQGWRAQSALLFTHRWKENTRMNIFPKGIRGYVKCKQPCPGFELRSPCPSPIIITMIPPAIVKQTEIVWMQVQLQAPHSNSKYKIGLSIKKSRHCIYHLMIVACIA